MHDMLHFKQMEYIIIFFFYRDDIPLCDDVLDVAMLLQNHISSALSLTKPVILIIRRSKPWRSFIKEMAQQKVDDTMNFEVEQFSTVQSTVHCILLFNWLHTSRMIPYL
jgi:hypothetical protein